MYIVVISDFRYPSRLDYAGHGLGRSAARLALALAKRGHRITFYGAPHSDVPHPNVTVVEHAGTEQELADYLIRQFASQPLPDAFIDSTHEFRLMHEAPDWPIVAKICDLEHTAPRNRVYGTSHHAWLHHEPGGLVVPEGLDVNEVPFNAGQRYDFWLWAAAKYGWKRGAWAQNVASRYSKRVLMVGDGPERGWWNHSIDIPALPPAILHEIMGSAEAFISGVPSMGMLEAAAAGTPSIALVRDEFIAEGITGYVVGEDGEGLGDLTALNRQAMRDWVAANRDINQTVLEWEAVLNRVINGERWGEESTNDDFVEIGGLVLAIRGSGQRRFWDEGIIRETQVYPIGDGPFHRVLDLGAHIGSFSCWMHKAHPEARILAVEADDDNYRLLFQNAGYFAQGLFHARIGYDDRPAWVFHPPDGNTGGNCIVFDREAYPIERLTPAPNMITLEHLVGEGLDLVKVDIEGGEYDVFAHCADDTLRKIKRIVGERHGTWDSFMERIGNRLSQFFTLTDCGHPNGVLDLGTFIAERK